MILNQASFGTKYEFIDMIQHTERLTINRYLVFPSKLILTSGTYQKKRQRVPVPKKISRGEKHFTILCEHGHLISLAPSSCEEFADV